LCARRIGNSGRVQRARPATPVFLPRTSRPPGVSWSRECACRPSALPIGPSTLALLPRGFEAQALERRLLRVAHARLHLALPIRIVHATRKRDGCPLFSFYKTPR